MEWERQAAPLYPPQDQARCAETQKLWSILEGTHRDLQRQHVVDELDRALDDAISVVSVVTACSPTDPATAEAIAALVDLTPATADASATNASWRSSSELDPMLAVMAGQRVEEFLRRSIERLIAGLGA